MAVVRSAYFALAQNGGPSVTSGAATPASGDVIIAQAAIWNEGSTSTAPTVSGTGTFAAVFPFYNDGVQDDILIAMNSSASAVSQTVTATGHSPLVGGATTLAVSYTGANAAGVTGSHKQVSNPGGGTGAITGNAVSVPVGAVLLCYCTDAFNGNGQINAAGTGVTTIDSNSGLGYCLTEYAGTGATITPSFTAVSSGTQTSAGIDVWQVLIPAATVTATPINYEVDWFYSDDEGAVLDDSNLTALLSDSAPVYRIDPLQNQDNYFEASIDDYEDPFVSDAEWASPIQPNAPSLTTQYFGDDAELLFSDDELGGQVFDIGYQTSNAPVNAIEDPWIWNYDDTDEEWITILDYDARPAPPVVTTPFQYFGEDAEHLIEDEPSQRYEEGYIQIDNPIPPPTVVDYFSEEISATLDEEAEDFFADHFSNVDADQTVYEGEYDFAYDDIDNDEWILLHSDDFDAAPTAPSATIQFGSDAELLDEQFDDEVGLGMDSDIPNNGYLQLREESYDFVFDDIEDESFLYDEILSNNASGFIPLVEDAYDYAYDDTDNDEWTLLHNDDFDSVGPNAPAALPVADAWLFEFDDIEDQWEIDEIVGASFVVPSAPCPEDPWSFDNDDTVDEWIELHNDDFDAVGPAAPVIVVEDPWDFAFDDIEDQWEIDEIPNPPFVNVLVDVADAWFAEFDDVEDQWEVDEVQNVNVPTLAEDSWDYSFDDIEDESFWHDEQTGANAIPKVSYYGQDAEELDEQVDDQLAEALDTDPVGPDYQALIQEDPWDYHEEVEDNWHDWPSESTPPNPTPYIDYGDDCLHFFEEMYLVDDDTDWFAVPVLVIIPRRPRLTISQVTTTLAVRR